MKNDVEITQMERLLIVLLCIGEDEFAERVLRSYDTNKYDQIPMEIQDKIAKIFQCRVQIKLGYTDEGEA